MRLASSSFYITEDDAFTNHHTSTKFHFLQQELAMEHFGNFIMYAKDREAAGAICLMKGVND